MRGIDSRTSGMQSERSTICATSPLRKRGAYDIWSLSSVNALVERSLLLHIVLKSASSMRVINPCVSHMPIACPYGWHASLVGSEGAFYVREMSLIHLSVSIVSFDVFLRCTLVFRCTNRFLSKLCFVPDVYLRILDVRINNFFWSKNIVSRCSLFCFQGSSEKLEMRGIDPRTSRMLSERSTIWATSSLRKRGGNAISNLSSVNAIVERSSFAYHSKNGFVDAGHQSMSFSHANRLPFWLTYTLVGSKGAIYFIRRSLILLSVE